MLFNRNLLWIFIALFLQIPCWAYGTETPGKAINLEGFRALEHDIKQILAKHDLVGFQLSINSADKKLWNMNYGLASISSNAQVNDQTLFRIGSISKTVTAVAIMQLVEQGLLCLDSTVQSLIPEIAIENQWHQSTPITVLHLLEHTAGFDDNHFKEYVVDGSAMSTKQALDYHPHTRVSRYKPGLFMSYANIDSTLLAYIVEKLSGLSFEEYVKRNVFEPLKMQHSDYFLNDYVRKNMARGYLKTSHGLTPTNYEFIKDRASGAINSSTTEMSRFQRMLINVGTYQGQRILSKSSVERMSVTESTLSAKAGFQEGYSKLLITQRSSGNKWLGHNGEMNGFLAAMWHNPARQVGYLFVGNTSGDNAYEADAEINRLLREFIVKQFPETLIKNNQKIMVSSVEYNSQLLGDYRQHTSRMSLIGFIDGLDSFSSVFVEDGSVKMKTSHSTYTLEPVARNAFTTRLTNGDEINVIFIQHQGQWYYQIPQIFNNGIQTSQFTKVASYTLLVGFAVMALVVFSLLVVQFLLGLIGIKVFRIKGLGYLSIADLGLFCCFMFLGSAGNSGMPFNVLGQPSIQSVGITISLLVFAVFSLLSVYKFWKFNQKYSCTGKNKFLIFVTACAMFFNLTMLVTLQYFDFLFVMLWIY
jgi:CubicO group peptidase (beta-lactamase class C family)